MFAEQGKITTIYNFRFRLIFLIIKNEVACKREVFYVKQVTGRLFFVVKNNEKRFIWDEK